MHFQYLPYIWILLVSASIATVLSVYAWRRRAVPGAAPFAFLMLAVVVWALSNGLEMMGTDLPTKLFWANVQYLCYASTPLALLALALEYTGRGAWLTPRNLILLSLVPVITAVLAWTNAYHGLLRRNVHLDFAGPFPVVAKTMGPWFLVFVPYEYLLMVVAVYLLLSAQRRLPSIYRGQALILVSVIIIPLTSSALYNLGLSPIPRHDVTPAIFSLCGVLGAWGLFRYRLFDLVPVARAAVIEGMKDGLVVLDGRQRIVDLNPAARRILGWTASQVIGKPAVEVFDLWPEMIPLIRDEAVTHAETAVEVGGAQQFYDLHISRLADKRGRMVGRVIMFHDVTESKQAQAQLLQQQRALAALEEREWLAREFHDDLGQTLGYVNVQAQAVRELLSRGQTQVADAALDRLAVIARDAHDDVREFILNVKETALTSRGLVSTLEQYVQRFAQYYGVHTELAVPDDLRDGAFDPVVEVQLLRIIQEALTNVRKHASAGSARLVFTRRDGTAQIVVEDDGCGFDLTSPGQMGTGHFGLHIMCERAEEVGGSLAIHSAPGKGTKVVVQVPVREGQ